MNNNQSNTNHNTNIEAFGQLSNELNTVNIQVIEQLSNELLAVSSGMQEVLDYISKISSNKTEDGQVLRLIAHSAPHIERLGLLTDNALNYALKKLDGVIDSHYTKDDIPNE